MKIAKGLWFEVLRLTCSPPPSHFGEWLTLEQMIRTLLRFSFQTSESLVKSELSEAVSRLTVGKTASIYLVHLNFCHECAASWVGQGDDGERVSWGQLGPLLKRGFFLNSLDEAFVPAMIGGANERFGCVSWMMELFCILPVCIYIDSSMLFYIFSLLAKYCYIRWCCQNIFNKFISNAHHVSVQLLSFK